jgi:antitoxin component of RelBE/YafQ-DinJ toxin-antitoxin module
MNGLQLNISRTGPGAGFHIDAHFRATPDASLVQIIDQTLRSSGLRVDKFNVYGASFVGQFDRLIFNGHNPEFHTVHTLDFRTASSLDTVLSKLEAVLSMVREQVAQEPIIPTEHTIPAPNDQAFQNLAQQRRLSETTVRGKHPSLGELHEQLSAALQHVYKTNPGLYDSYGEVLRGDPLLRNVFYREELTREHLEHPEVLNPTGSLSPYAHDTDHSPNL